MVKCKKGKEKETVLKLMRKYIALTSSDQPLLIKSAVTPEGIKGYIFIEAFNKNDVIKAINKQSNKLVVKLTMMVFLYFQI